MYTNKLLERKSIYNYQREHWLSIISIINVHLTLNNNAMTKNGILTVIRQELSKYKRNITAEALLEKFLESKLYIYKESMISLPDNNIDRTFG